MDFSTIKAITIPNGEVTKIEIGGSVIWQKQIVSPISDYQEVEWIQAADGVIEPERKSTILRGGALQ